MHKSSQLRGAALNWTALGWLTAAAALGWLAAGEWHASRNAAAEKDELKSASVALAQAYVKLAELDLQSALDANKRIPDSFAANEIERLQRAVDAAKARATSAKDNDANLFADYAASAKDGVRVAEAQVAQAAVANQSFPGTIGPLELQRLNTQVEIAKLRLQQLEFLKTAEPLDQLRWQVDFLAADLADLKTRVLNFSIKN
ncbi:MAG TPA: hypothetical protein VGE52_02275 [Pirellulales bacterium]